MIRHALAVGAGLALGACQTHVQDVVNEPHLTPVGSALASGRSENLHAASARIHASPSNSTWRDGTADLFRDPRAATVGDVVTVKIAMKDKASLDNTSNRSRDSKGGLGATLKYGLAAFGLAKAGDGEMDVSMKGATSTQGKGAITRSEIIDLMLAAVVTDVLPNGNLVISGSQEVRVNFEVRVLNLAGIVRTRDISSDNSISYDKIAEARISYGGRGRITEVQQPGWGQQIIDLLAPY